MKLQLGVSGAESQFQERTLFALFLLCQGSRETRAAVIARGVIEDTIQAMELWYETQLIARAVAFIYVLAIEPQGRLEIVQRGGAAALIKGLQRQMADRCVVGLALRALAFLVPQVLSSHLSCT